MVFENTFAGRKTGCRSVVNRALLVSYDVFGIQNATGS
jgi:hypothetical protein